MNVRAETAAATRQALLDAASALLDGGGVDAVTLRDVGSGAGVSRSAAYRHFVDKEDLLMAVSAAAWDSLATRLRGIAADATLSPDEALRGALGALVQVARTRPHLYRLMFARTVGDATAAVQAATRAQDVFLAIVGRIVEGDGMPQMAGLLMAATHGIVDLDLSGHLTPEKWGTGIDGMVDLLVRIIRPL
ncbi:MULTISPECIES: TetR/AcrR family transcriptional regulator [Thermomonosporaceae]|uniref:TetR/AcrR family transcriptional regulator n=1 Tax=Thermomonosporaceae TaxID=2012 RepID=UPI00255B36E9|nr:MULTISPECIES: TetR/AcrR family transcriptional regulator [Thermomonosporaceae]MDL4773105.1 TetR/AcrR family transcriptional regulator [Actinomadura xylanilytica]